MHRVIYTSRSTRPLERPELHELLEVSRERNDADGLTGMLLHYAPEEASEATFLQVLEGSRKPLERTYARISGDGRHTDMTLVSSRTVDERAFGDWTMGLEYVTEADLDRTLPGFSASDPSAVRVRDLLSDPVVAETLLQLYVS